MTATAEASSPPPVIRRPVPSTSILVATGATDIAVRGGTSIEIDGKGFSFPADRPVDMLDDWAPGQDYHVGLTRDGQPFATLATRSNPLSGGWFAGFHFAPGGNAAARAGGDDVPAVNPCSLWDVDFRPDCPDPRGMTLVETKDGARFWADIYLLGTEHNPNGTSRFGATIADGRSLSLLDYKTAVDIYAGHGKRLMTYEEFRAAAYGVTEKSGIDDDPETTGLDAARTSRFGLMQATGNLWVWGTDGDPDDPRPSLFGGSWFYGGRAGSRCASLDTWPERSVESIGARGACDHLSPA
jgi:hypothetical protein